MNIKVSELPGVGKKVTFINNENKMMVLVIHYTGKRELYFFQNQDDDESAFSFELTSEDTRQLALQLFESHVDQVEQEKIDKVRMIRNKMVLEWVDVKQHVLLAGMTVSELKGKLPKGVTLIGLIRQDDILVDSYEEQMIEINDTVMLLGKKDPLVQFMKRIEGENE